MHPFATHYQCIKAAHGCRAAWPQTSRTHMHTHPGSNPAPPTLPPPPPRQVPGSNAGVGVFAAPDAPALFVAPGAREVAAFATAAGRVARMGQDQRTAAGAFAAREGAPARELWPGGMFKEPPKYCTACRGK